jgi:hypothetical protein
MRTLFAELSTSMLFAEPGRLAEFRLVSTVIDCSWGSFFGPVMRDRTMLARVPRVVDSRLLIFRLTEAATARETLCAICTRTRREALRATLTVLATPTLRTRLGASDVPTAWATRITRRTLALVPIRATHSCRY